jgi:hypothetical protein
MTDLNSAPDAIRLWGEERDWAGYDPYDALNSPAAPVLTLRTALGARILTQAVKRSPINLRPLLGIRPAHNDKALGLVASAYARLAAAREDESAAAAARRWLDHLIGVAVTDESGLAWGYNFPVRTRFFGYDRGAPNTIATAFVAHALLDGLELLGEERFGDAANDASTFLLGRMLDEEGEAPFFRYLTCERELVHNANLLACSVAVRTASLRREPLDTRVEEAVRVSVDAQREDGSWPYSAGPAGSWVDNFHTGYVLESLVHCSRRVEGLAGVLERGIGYWHRELFLVDGTPKHTVEVVHPIDAHDYAQAIETWLSVADRHPTALERAEHAATLLIDRMLDPRGYVWFQRGRFVTSKVPFVRWTTAPAFRALAGLELASARVS